MLQFTVLGQINEQRTPPVSFAPRKSVCSGPSPSFSVYGSLSLSCSCTATHGKWQPYCTRAATLANPRTHTTVKMFEKRWAHDVLTYPVFLRSVTRRVSLGGTAKYSRSEERFAKKLWKSDYWCDESLFTTRLRVRSAVDARVSLASLLDGWYSRLVRNFATRWQNQSAFLTATRTISLLSRIK